MKNVLTIILLLTGMQLLAQVEETRIKNYNLDDKNLAIQGYDPVSYHLMDEPLKGKKEFTSKFKGVYYRFATKANQEAFKKNPRKYEPNYGGWCAYAMASGEKVKIDPETYKIVDGQLNLFYNFNFTNTLKSWNKDESNLKTKADSHWIGIIDL